MRNSDIGMHAKLTTFPVGASQGLIVLRLTCEGPFDADAANNLVASRMTSGTWSVWLESDAWTSKDLASWVESRGDLSFICLRNVGDEEWPSFAIFTVLDASDAVAECETHRDVLGAIITAPHIPRAVDLVVTVTTPAMDTESLDVLSQACPVEQGRFIYAEDEVIRAGLVRAAAHARARWAIR